MAQTDFMSTQLSAPAVMHRVAARTGAGIWRHRGGVLLALALTAAGAGYIAFGSPTPALVSAELGSTASSDCADTGVLGFVSLGWLLWALVLGSVRSVWLASNEDWPWRAALLASLCAWLVHAVLDDFERFWPTSVAFWLIAGLSLTLSSSKSRVSD